MDAGSATLIEKNVDRAASALLAAAAAYAAHAAIAGRFSQALGLSGAAGAAALAFLASLRVLNGVKPEAPRLPVPVFDVRQIEESQPAELLLTDRLEQPQPPANEEPLVLDDVLAELGPDSRVVRLFDPKTMPTPGQLNDRIERHLLGEAGPAAPQDASQALHDALAELRRSLR